jgi:hypothetical protein
MKSEYINILLRNVDYISEVTFTGGEPSLNPQIINQFLDIVRKYNVGVGNFYIATNAIKADDEFIKAILNLYLYCDDNEISQLHISNDNFHTINQDTVKRLLAFKFSSLKYDKSPIYEHMVNEGRFHKTYNIGRENSKYEADIEDTAIYLNCKGNVINGCDWSYAHQDNKSNIICQVNDFSLDAIEAYNTKYHNK